MANEYKITALNNNKCSGCHLCRLICSYTKTGRFDPNNARISVLERDESGFVQLICRNCIEAPCMDVCPAGAIIKRKKDGYVLLKKEKCIGCNMCAMVCPFNAIGRSEHSNYKCDTCDGSEKCSDICEQGAIEFIDCSTMLKEKRRKLLERIVNK